MALKCGNCRYFVKEGWFSSYCDYRRRMHVKNDLTSANMLACGDYYPVVNDYNSALDNNGTTSNCFLTSACVEYLGKPDDCEELTVLREFRDNYMAGLENGQALIEEYYAVAPAIVEKIKVSESKEECFAYIYGVIKRCLALIARRDNEGALSEYKSMVTTLKEKLLND